MQKKKLIVHFLISLLVIALLVAAFDYVVLQNLLQDYNGVASYRMDYAGNIIVTNVHSNAHWLIFPGIVLFLSGLETFLYRKFRGKKHTREPTA